METSKYAEWINQVRQAAEAAAVPNGLSCLAKDVARTEVSQDTCKEKRIKIFINVCVCTFTPPSIQYRTHGRPICHACGRPRVGLSQWLRNAPCAINQTMVPTFSSARFREEPSTSTSHRNNTNIHTILVVTLSALCAQSTQTARRVAIAAKQDAGQLES
jgi:hypothetical protein